MNNALFVEGGIRTIKKYKRLLLRRIKWVKPEGEGESQEQDQEMSDNEANEESEETSIDLKCHLIWEGIS